MTHSARGSKSDEQGGLLDEVIVGIGMGVMVTYNIETDLDLESRTGRH